MSPSLSGSCPSVDSPGGPVFPSETVLTLAGSGSGPWKVPLAGDGTLTGFLADLAGGAAPGSYTFATTCGGSAPFLALAAPTLRLDPAGTRAGETVVVPGPVRGRPGGQRRHLPCSWTAASSAPHLSTRRRPVRSVVRGGTGRRCAGGRQVSTSCGGRATVTVLPPVAVQVACRRPLPRRPPLRWCSSWCPICAAARSSRRSPRWPDVSCWPGEPGAPDGSGARTRRPGPGCGRPAPCRSCSPPRWRPSRTARPVRPC